MRNQPRPFNAFHLFPVLAMRKPLVFAILLFVVYSLLLEHFPMPHKVVAQSQWQQNQYFVEKYLRDSEERGAGPRTVIVGSSLARRLEFDGAELDCVYNLALTGDSSLTGLSVIAHSPFSPRSVLVEINVPQNSTNHTLIERASSSLSRLSSVFHIENMPINILVSFLHKVRGEKPPRPPIESVRLNALALQVGAGQELVPAPVLQKNMGEFRLLVDLVEAKGVEVIFFELPVHPDLESLPRTVQIRQAFRGTFPAHTIIQFEELAGKSSIRTYDGVHLLEGEAKAVVENLKSYLRTDCDDPEN